MKYADIHEKEYDHIIFVDCENSKTFESSRKIINETFHDELDNFLCKNKRKCLLIVDNVDTENLSKSVFGFLPKSAETDVIITGRYGDLPVSSKNTLPIGPLSDEDAVRLFRKALQEGPCREKFDCTPKEIKYDFVKEDLGAIPLAIRITATIFNERSQSGTPYSIEQHREKLKDLNIDEMAWFTIYIQEGELGYVKNIIETYQPNIEHIEKQIDKVHKGGSVMVKDVLRFLAFFGTLQNIKYPKLETNFICNHLLQCFLNSSENKDFYKNLSVDKFINLFSSITSNLNKHSLIEVHDRIITIPLTVKWAVQYEFLSSDVIKNLEEKRNREIAEKREVSLLGGLFFNAPDLSKTEQELDRARYSWFNGAASYFNAIANPEQINDSYLSDLTSFIDFIKKYKLSDYLKAHFINEMPIWKLMANAIVNNDSKFLSEIHKLPTDELYTLLESIINQNKEFPAKIGEAIANLAQLYIDSDAEKSKRMLDLAALYYHDAHFYLGLWFLKQGIKIKYENNNLFLSQITDILRLDHKKSKDEIETHIFQQAIRYYSMINDASAYHNRALCYRLLKDNNEAIKDFERAIKLNPFNPLFHTNLAETYIISGRPDSKQKGKKEAEIAEGLKFLQNQPEYKGISKEYKATLLKFLISDEIFSLKEDWTSHTMDDRGILFGKTLNYNPRISIVQLHGCDLDDVGLQEIAKSLETNQVIRRIDLEWNSRLTDIGIAYLIKALKQNKTINYISLNECVNFKKEAIQSLIDVVKNETTIDLKKTNIKKGQVKERTGIKINF